ncbi:glutamate racemase [Nitrosopumilus adriaticus]|uniref:glutamate racemase n=1 Tax=Nitrosopumilus adriaticus TaxID=1580092 RepID=UPI00352E6612
MVRIVVFDSGLGSLSVIKSIQKQMKCNIIYFADSKHFPYGKKSINELRKITSKSISSLQTYFMPEVIVVASNTLSLTLNSHSKNIHTVLPPLNEAKKLSKSKSIAILATESIVKSKLLDNYIKNFQLNNFKIIKINASPLIELVEDGNFYSNPNYCKNKIKKILSTILLENNVDVATMSSTHLPFLLKFFKQIFPQIIFLDPNEALSKKLKKEYDNKNIKRNTMKIFTSGDIESLQIKLSQLKIKTRVFKYTLS